MSTSTRCAACKNLRRRCSQDCIFAPYFPSSNPKRFSQVHKIFGASNVGKNLQQLPEHLRARSAECMSFEAARRVEDPVYGSAGIISHLQQQILEAQEELSKVQCQIAYHSAKLQIQLGNWMTPKVHGSRDDTASVSMPAEFVHQLQQPQSSLPASVSDSHFTVDFTREELDEFNW